MQPGLVQVPPPHRPVEFPSFPGSIPQHICHMSLSSTYMRQPFVANLVREGRSAHRLSGPLVHHPSLGHPEATPHHPRLHHRNHLCMEPSLQLPAWCQPGSARCRGLFWGRISSKSKCRQRPQFLRGTPDHNAPTHPARNLNCNLTEPPGQCDHATQLASQLQPSNNPRPATEVHREGRP